MAIGAQNITLSPLANGTQDNANECKLLPSTNSSFPLAANWENIPETLILNSLIGFILFVAFIILTYIAWNRANDNDDYANQNLVAFLYGYRDPDRWYVMPRYEFLKLTNRHHVHDLEYPYIYVPPRLPLANPIKLLDYGFYDYKSEDENHTDDSQRQSFKSMSVIDQNQTMKGDKRLVTNKSPIVLSKSSATKSPTLANRSRSAPSSKINAGKQVSPLDTIFFYPSIFSAEQLQASYISRKLNLFFSKFFRITDADMIYAKGIDAYEYLLFQRHLILIMFIINIFCIGVILPVHWFFGENHINSGKYIATTFQRSTIKNMSSTSNFYWAHILCSIFIVAITILILNSYRESTTSKHDTQLSRRTLLIGNIPVGQRNRVKLLDIMKEYFTGSTVEAIQFVYDTSLLEQYHMQLDSIIVAKEYCFYYKRKYNRELMVKPSDVNEDQVCNGLCRICSFFYICCCYWPCECKQLGTDFYTQREQYYRDKIKSNCEKMVQEPSEYAFITFKSNRQARRVMKELSLLKTETLQKERSTSVARRNNSSLTSRSLSPNSIESGYSVNTDAGADRTTGAKKTASNYDFLVANTTGSNDPLDPKNNPHIRSIRSPVAQKTSIGLNNKQSDGNNSFETNLKDNRKDMLEGPLAWSIRYAPQPDNVEYYDLLHLATTSKYTTVLLHVLMVVIFIFFTTPNVILSIVEKWSVLQPDKAKEKTGFQSILINYVSILLQIITTAALPSLVILISKQIPYEDTASKSYSMMWKVYLFLVLMVIVMPSIGMSSFQAFLTGSNIKANCLFPTDNGAYFINYVVTSIFLSTVLELIKPTDILSYYFILWTGRSPADYEGGRQYIEREFSVSMQHTGVLLVFSVVLTYTISCPLIAPAGLLYLIVKHAVDHYHLFYTYFTKNVDKNLQSTIEIFVKVALLLMLFQTAVAITSTLRTGYLPLVSQMVFGVSLAVFLFNCFYDCTSQAIMATKRNRFHREFCACFYLPRVVEDLLKSNAIPDKCVSRKVR